MRRTRSRIIRAAPADPAIAGARSGRSPLAPGIAVAFAAALLAPLASAHSQETPQAFEGATLITIASEPVEDGVLVVHRGRIVAAGTRGAVRVPDGARRHDVSGRVIMPGLVDTHSHVGGGDGGDRSAPMHPSVRILDALDAQDDGIHRARAGGITSVNIMPGSGHLLSGQTVYLKLRSGRTIYDLLYCEDVLRDVCGGMKMANGTNPRSGPPFPGTRAMAASIVRKKLVQAQEYGAKLEQAERDPDRRVDRDLELEALAEVLDGRRIVHHHTHRHDDILTVLRLQREFGFRLVLQHVSEAWKVADEIAAAGVPSSIIVIDAPGGKLEATGLSLTTGRALEEAGAVVGFHTDDWITDSRLFLRSAALAVRAGMSRQAALEGLTLAGAKMMDLEERIGTLEAGKDADFIVLSGDPLRVATRVLQTWVEGEKVFDLDDEEDRRYAVGGFKVGDRRDVDPHAGLEGH